MFAINRFVHEHYPIIQYGVNLRIELLDSQFGLTCLKRNH